MKLANEHCMKSGAQKGWIAGDGEEETGWYCCWLWHCPCPHIAPTHLTSSHKSSHSINTLPSVVVRPKSTNLTSILSPQAASNRKIPEHQLLSGFTLTFLVSVYPH